MSARTLILAAHGSPDPGYPRVFDWIADRVVGSRPDLDVRIGYLDHREPRLAELATAGTVVVPMLLGSTFHLWADIPAAAPDAIVAQPLGPDPELMTIVADRLSEAGWTSELPVTLAGAAEAGLPEAATMLAELIGGPVEPLLVGSGQSSLPSTGAVAPYLLAPGHFAHLIASCGAPVISKPIGADPRVADLVMRRYDAAQSRIWR